MWKVWCKREDSESSTDIRIQLNENRSLWTWCLNKSEKVFDPVSEIAHQSLMLSRHFRPLFYWYLEKYFLGWEIVFTYVAFSGPVWSCYICIAWNFGASFHGIGKVYMPIYTSINTAQVVVVLWGFFLFYIITYNIYRTTVCETFQNAHSNSQMKLILSAIVSEKLWTH